LSDFDLSVARRIHVVGIGGTGMSAIATLLAAGGHQVTGSDAKESPFLDRLRAEGVQVWTGHDADHVRGSEAVAISSAVRRDNPEVVAAGAAGIPVLSRAQILRLLTASYRTVAVAGTHGKTTTSALLTAALEGAGFDPSYLLGSQLLSTGTNAHRGGEVLVCEADESDGTFLEMVSAAAVVTNVEADHLEKWGDIAALEAAFGRFLAGVEGPRVVCFDDPGARRAATGIEVTGYGTGSDCRFRAVDVEPSGRGSRFRLVVDDADAATVALAMPGRHNVLNATAAVATAVLLGGDVQAAAAGVERFRGVGRRFELRDVIGGVTFVDDYAHLPTEVAAAIAAGREGDWARIVAVFQPHLFSRTVEHADGFGAALAAADLAYVADVFPARESAADFPDVTGRIVADAVSAHGGRAVYVDDRSRLAEEVASDLKEGDLCLTIGAGDVTTIADEVAPLLLGDDLIAEAAEVDAVFSELAAVLAEPPVRRMPMGAVTTYRIGGPAAVFAEPADEVELLAAGEVISSHDLDVLILGRGSNLLVGDRGFRGVVLRLGSGFNWIDADVASATVRAGAATPLPYLAREVSKFALAGLEFGVGIPASVGGAVRMNAGGHGAEIRQVLSVVGVVDLRRPECGVQVRRAESLGLSYRSSNLSDREVVVWAGFALRAGDAAELRERMTEITRWRKEHHPAGEGNCGSVFTNPPGDHAARLIDDAGLKGLRVGGAYVSDKHANFIMAEPWARPSEVVALVAEVRRRVREFSGVDLQPEVRTVGEFEA